MRTFPFGNQSLVCILTAAIVSSSTVHGFCGLQSQKHSVVAAEVSQIALIDVVAFMLIPEIGT